MKVFMLRTVVIATLLCSILAPNVVHADYSVGVKPGDYMIYDLEATYLNATLSETVNITVQNVEGILITGTFEATSQGAYIVPPEQFALDVTTGVGESARGFIVPANLTVGNDVPGGFSTVLNVTELNGRTAIVANATAPFLQYPAQDYWDQSTGILLQSAGSFQGTVFTMTLTDTNLWTIGFTLSLLVLAFPIAVIVVVIVALASRFYVKKGAKKPSNLTDKPEHSTSPRPSA